MDMAPMTVCRIRMVIRIQVETNIRRYAVDTGARRPLNSVQAQFETVRHDFNRLFMVCAGCKGKIEPGTVVTLEMGTRFGPSLITSHVFFTQVDDKFAARIMQFDRLPNLMRTTHEEIVIACIDKQLANLRKKSLWRCRKVSWWNTANSVLNLEGPLNRRFHINHGITASTNRLDPEGPTIPRRQVRPR